MSALIRNSFQTITKQNWSTDAGIGRLLQRFVWRTAIVLTMLGTLLPAIVTTRASAQSPAFPTQRCEADALHEAIMRRMMWPELLHDYQALPGATEVSTRARAFASLPADYPVEAQWGCTIMALPNYLRSDTLGLLPGQGLLISQVDASGPAAFAGLCTGQLLLAIDGQACTADQPLPPLDRQRCVTVLSDQGVSELTIEPAIASVSWPPQELGVSSFRLPYELGRQEMRLKSFCSPQQPIRSLSISQAGGQTVVAAIADTLDGPVNIELRGTPEEIRCQLQEFSPEIQHALQSHLGW